MAQPPKAQPTAMLTPALIADQTGVPPEEHAALAEIEIIFTNVHDIGPDGIARCAALRALTLIDTGLRRIRGLDAVGRSLERLCLSDQNLTRIEGLSQLPMLRELLLHQNAIAKIEGLDGCPRLRRLWLFSNRVTKIEGLHGCGDLRELWLQARWEPILSRTLVLA
jgi:Leucine-rich repeat (LRR) protein